jgi:hypothetical protein
MNFTSIWRMITDLVPRRQKQQDKNTRRERMIRETEDYLNRRVRDRTTPWPTRDDRPRPTEAVSRRQLTGSRSRLRSNGRAIIEQGEPGRR